jgi:hypothetical protein
MTAPLHHLHAVALDPLPADEAEWQTLFAAIRMTIAEPA